MESIGHNTTFGIPQDHPSARMSTTTTHILTPTNIFLALTLYLLTTITISALTSPKYPTTLPWIGRAPSWLSLPSTILASFTQTPLWMAEGYARFSKNEKSFVLAGTIGSPPEIVIPRSEIRWMLDQPDSVLSSSAAHYDILGGDYNFTDKAMLGDPYHEHVVHKSIARNLGGVIEGISAAGPGDVDLVIAKLIGKDKTNNEQWHSINPFDMFMSLVPRIGNRMIIGEPACTNQEFLDAVSAFMSDVVRGMLVFAMLPKPLHPIFGPILSLIPRYHYWVSSKHSLPLIKQRLHDMQRKDSNDPAYKDWKEPNDFITWTIKTARSENRPNELVPSRIAKRIMPLNFAAIHTTSLTSHSALLDILASDPSVLHALRTEASRVFIDSGNQWTKAALTKLHKLDSAFRESQRFSSFAQTFVHRKVVEPKGVTKPDGTFCAWGTMIVAPWVQISRDEDLHDEGESAAGVYDAFRYSRVREAWEGRGKDGEGEEERDEGLKLRVLQSGQVTTSDRHLPFGHGRHACPGRFFISYAQKVIFSHLILNYDLKHLGERPAGSWIGKTFVPPFKTRMEIRRREKIWTIDGEEA